MRRGQPIKDKSVTADGALRDETGFLKAERELLRQKGWKYDPKTQTWQPPQPVAQPAPPPKPR